MSDISNTDIDKRPMPGGGVNKPSSGTYGERAGVAQLKQALPQTGAAGPPGAPPGQPLRTDPISPTQGMGGRPTGPSAPPGVPDVLMHPTDRPGVPVSTPLGGDPLRPEVLPPVDNHMEGRLRALDLLVEDSRVSPAMKEWAANARAMLSGGDPVALGA